MKKTVEKRWVISFLKRKRKCLVKDKQVGNINESQKAFLTGMIWCVDEIIEEFEKFSLIKPAEIQEMIRRNELKLDNFYDLMQKLTRTIYSDLCELSSQFRNIFDEANENEIALSLPSELNAESEAKRYEKCCEEEMKELVPTGDLEEFEAWRAGFKTMVMCRFLSPRIGKE